MHSLTRMWVLFELLRSVEFGKILQLRPLNVILDVAGENRCSIQMSTTGCANPHDLTYITQEMEKVGGVKVLNEKVRLAMVRAFQNGITEAVNAKNSSDEGVARLRALLGSTYVDQGDFKEATSELELALQTAEKLQATYRPHTIAQHEITEWRLQLGKALSSAGNDSEAVVAMRKAVEDEEEWVAQRLCRNRLNFVDVLRRSGKFREASDELKKAQSYCVDFPLMLADFKLKLGQQMSHWEWRNLTAAHEFCGAIEIHCAHFGVDHVTTAKTKYNLAICYRRMHRLGESEDLHREVHKVQCDHLDADHLDVLNSRMNLGILLGHQGDFEAAMTELEEVVRLHRQKDPDHPKLAIALVCLGDVNRYAGASQSAMKNYQDAFAIYNAIKNFEHGNEIAWAHTSLAYAFMESVKDVKDWGVVRESLEQSLDQNKQIFGEEHLSVAASLVHIGTSLRLQGEFQTAETKYKEALKIYEIVIGHYPEGLPWVSKQLELCAQKKSFLLPCPVEVVARSRVGRSNDAINWPELFDKFCIGGVDP